MKKYICLALILLTILPVYSQKKELQLYINFIEKNSKDPVEYIFELFEKYDIVILGERDHRDTIQYDLVDKIISDPRFAKRIGNVFSEVGLENRKDEINHVLKANYSSWQAFEDSLRIVYPKMDYQILWEKYNYWKFLSSIYRVNRTLKKENKITYYPTDVTFDWNDYRTNEQYRKFRNSIDKVPQELDRDVSMGLNFIKFYSQILNDPKQKRKKALAIYNCPHSYQSYKLFDHPTQQEVYATSVIISNYLGKVANVMLNSWRFGREGKDRLIHDGKWDAAFRYLDNPSIGFNFRGNPFGNDEFDQSTRAINGVKYKDVYTGFIFYKPIEDWKCTIGIPQIITKNFKPEFIRRLYVVYPECTDDEINIDIGYYEHLRTYSQYTDKTPKDSIDMYINSWLK